MQKYQLSGHSYLRKLEDYALESEEIGGDMALYLASDADEQIEYLGETLRGVMMSEDALKARIAELETKLLEATMCDCGARLTRGKCKANCDRDE
jgi:hypothetical protein